jgi:hypothetical protein
VSPVRYKLGFYIPEDNIRYSRRRENLKSYFVYVIDATAKVVDVSVEFEGQTEASLTLTVAAASSLVNGSTSALVFLDAKPAKPSPASMKLEVTSDTSRYSSYKLMLYDEYTFIFWTFKKKSIAASAEQFTLLSSQLLKPLERPQLVQPLGRFPAFYGTRRFITEFTRALHLYLS